MLCETSMDWACCGRCCGRCVICHYTPIDYYILRYKYFSIHIYRYISICIDIYIGSVYSYPRVIAGRDTKRPVRLGSNGVVIYCPVLGRGGSQVTPTNYLWNTWTIFTNTTSFRIVLCLSTIDFLSLGRWVSMRYIETGWGQMRSLLLDSWWREIPVIPFKLILQNTNVIHKHLGVMHLHFHPDMEINQKWGVCWDTNRPFEVKRARYYPIIGQGRSQSPTSNWSSEMWT